MSPLTKVFVVVLVVLSLLLAAASVTLLSTVPNYQTQVTTLTAARDAATAEGNRRAAASDAQQAALQTRATELTGQLQSAGEQVASLRTAVAKAEADKADLQGQLAQTQTTQAQLASAANASTALSNELRQQVSSLRNEYDKTLSQYADITKENSTTSQNLQFTERKLRDTLEQLKDASSSNDQLQNQLRQNGLNPGQQTAGAPVSAPPINGVIIETSRSGGQLYASISVGTEDDVKAGMRFTVLNPQTSEFLGFLTVEQPDDTTSIGRLTGPKAASVSANDEVRTQVDAVASGR